MKKQFIFGALMALVAMGVVFASCTNVDNPYNTTTPEGKYVMLQDSTVASFGDKRIINWEYDAKGRMAKETVDYYADDTSVHYVSTFTYSQNMITREMVTSNGETDVAYFYLNSKGLVERYVWKLYGIDCGYEYDDDDRIMIYTDNDGGRVSVVWDNGDVVIESETKDDSDSHTAYYTSTDYEVNFPYMMPYLNPLDTALTPMGCFGKSSRHLISNYNYVYEANGHSVHCSNTCSYVVRNGLVMEFSVDVNEVVTTNGESEEISYIEHHYLTWEKQ